MIQILIGKNIFRMRKSYCPNLQNSYPLKYSIDTNLNMKNIQKIYLPRIFYMLILSFKDKIMVIIL